jgi:hypothetical protein
MLRNDERWVIYMDAGVRFVPAKAPNVMTLDELHAVLASVLGTKDALHFPDQTKRDEAITLDRAEMRTIGGLKALVLMFSYTNQNGADPGFREMVAGTNRTEPKKKNEAVASSAHLVISTVPHGRAGSLPWAAMLEDVAGVGKTKMQSAVTAMIKAKLNFSWKDADGQVRGADARFVLDGRDSDDVAKEIENGTLAYFVAIKESKEAPDFDEDGFLVTTREEIKLKPTGKDGISMKDLLKKVGKIGKQLGYEKVRVHYKRVDGKGRSMTYGTHREDAEDFLIKRVELIKLPGQNLAQNYTQPCVPLLTAMFGKLK